MNGVLCHEKGRMEDVSYERIQSRRKCMTDKWLKITIIADPLLLEPISDFLVGVLEAGVEEAAPDEPDYGRVQAYIQKSNLTAAEREEMLGRVRLFLEDIAGAMSLPIPSCHDELIEDEDWGKKWKAHFHSFTIVPGLVIAPSWEEYVPEPGEKVIVMDPGMAFGTGHHATTTLCLEGVRECLAQRSVARVLDVGCGTGILGMAALLFGAESALGVDNDEVAVSAAEKNIFRNNLAGQMEVTGSDLVTVSGSFDLVVANIVHDVLLLLADDLDRLTGADGQLILSGLMGVQQVASLRDHFLGREFQLVREGFQQEWGMVWLKKGSENESR